MESNNGKLLPPPVFQLFYYDKAWDELLRLEQGGLSQQEMLRAVEEWSLAHRQLAQLDMFFNQALSHAEYLTIEVNHGTR